LRHTQPCPKVVEKRRKFVAIPSAVPRNSWNLIFGAAIARGLPAEVAGTVRPEQAPQAAKINFVALRLPPKGLRRQRRHCAANLDAITGSFDHIDFRTPTASG
jgi:hypothetical protein